MSGSKKQKAYRRTLRQRAASGIGHDAHGDQKNMKASDPTAKSLAAGYRVGDYAKRRGRHE